MVFSEGQLILQGNLHLFIKRHSKRQSTGENITRRDKSLVSRIYEEVVQLTAESNLIMK